jgi:uncharacterized protein
MRLTDLQRKAFGHFAKTLLPGAVGVLLALSAAGYGYLADRLPRRPLTIETAQGPVEFTVEVPTTARQQERGLMYRKSLGPTAGMLFVFGQQKPVYFWMKNTYISLDIIFIDSQGRVVRVARETQPESEHVIPSGAPVQAALEINGGLAAHFGIKPGDKVPHLFDATAPVAP